jgi:hypothetical protein
MLQASMLQFRQGGIGIQASGGPRNRYRWCPFMPAPHPKTVVVLALLLSLFLLNTVNTAAVAQQHAPRKRPAKQEQPAPPPPPPPAPPPPPPTLEQMPAVPPKVSFSKGLLTIVAENSTLSDILRAVRTQTGAAVEVPPNATERVVTHLGPGAPRDVLASLLNGSHFNYVMLGSPTNPNMVDRVILTSKSGSVPDPGSAPMPMPSGQDNTAAVPMEESESQQGADISEQPVDDAGENASNGENQAQPANGQPQVKTPEQLLRELQMQQQQQQQQPPQGAPPGQAPQ